MNRILETAKVVSDSSQHVKISDEGIAGFVSYFEPKHMRHWFSSAPYDIQKLLPKERLMFLLIFNSISFSYWGTPKWTIEYKGQKLDGSYGMIGSLGKAIEQGYPILDAAYLSKIPKSEFARILEGNVQIPLFEERHQILMEVGRTVEEKFDGDVANLVQGAEGDAVKLLNSVIGAFPSFNDVSSYKGRQVLFYKRAQLLVEDVVQAFNGREFGKLENVSEITACADYKLPLVLRRLGVFSYSKPLAEKVDNRIEIKRDSVEEVEIRANTIWAVERIRQRLEKKIPRIHSIYINDHLWLLGQEKLKGDKPYHLTRTTAY